MDGKTLSGKWLLIIGIALLVGAAGVFGYTQIKYAGWVEVSPTYQESNCQTESVRSSGKVHQVTYCDLQMSYTYDGNTYDEIQNHVELSSLRPATRFIDPKSPSVSEESASKNLIGCILASVGLLFGLLGFFIYRSGRRGQKRVVEQT